MPFAKLSGAEQAHAQQVLNQLGLKLKSYSEIVAQYENINDIGQLIKAEKKYISEIVTDITERNLDTFEEALCYIRDNYDVFVALCKEKQKGSLEADVLSTGVISLI